MKFLSGIVAATLMSVVSLPAANAADMSGPGPAGYKDVPFVGVNWSGPYLGVNFGGGWSESSDQLALPGSFGGLAPGGIFGGGQIGYNFQGWWHPQVVLGVEADIQGASLRDTGTDVSGDTFSSHLNWFGTVRGRVGYAFDRALVYATGGLAYGEVHNNFDNVFNIDTTAVGWVVGGGAEYKATPAWSVKGEYQFVDLGKNDPTFAGVSFASIGGVVREDAYHTFRVGVNYFIGGIYTPLK